MGVPDPKRVSARNELAGGSTEPRLPTIARSLSRRINEKTECLFIPLRAMFHFRLALSEKK